MNHLPVLIVGAGPTGLMLACELERHDIPFRIIDKKSEPTMGSNATWIQTRTLEVFDAMGIADQFIRIGHQCKAINFYEKDKHLASLPVNQIDSMYPFVLMLAQRETERLLTQRLEKAKIRVERSFELINVEQKDNLVYATIRLPDGDTETVTSNWLIACDGANSTVREKCGFSFPGENIPEQFMVADVKMSSYLPTNEIHVFFEKGVILAEKATIFSAFPLGSKEYRLSANLYQSQPRQEFHPHEVKEVVAERTYGNFVVEDVSWISPFWIHSKIADQLQHGRIFLMGDAAHIHSPAGGQGMNSGLQDAYNLAWKLALVIKNKAKSSLLNSYQSERYPVVHRVVEQTEQLTKMMLFDKKFFTRLHQFCKTLSQPAIANTIVAEVTELDICYQESPVIDYHEKPGDNSPRQGQRAPDVVIGDKKHLYHYLQNTLHNVLIFAGMPANSNIVAQLDALQKQLQQSFSGLIKMHIISGGNLNLDNLIIDKDGMIHKRYGVSKPAIYVIRPDNYIGYFSPNIDASLLENFLHTYLGSIS